MATDRRRVRRVRLRRAATAIVVAGSLSVGGVACTPPSEQEVAGALSALWTVFIINLANQLGICWAPCLPVPNAPTP